MAKKASKKPTVITIYDNPRHLQNAANAQHFHDSKAVQAATRKLNQDPTAKAKSPGRCC